MSIVSIPAPVGGWNTRDSLDSMPPTDAVSLENFIPQPGKVTLRKGYAEHSDSSESTAVETLTEFHAGSTQKLIGATGTKVFDFTSASASSIGTGFTNARWQTANFNGYLHMVNGADAPQNYEGTTLAAAGWTGSGLTPSDLNGVNVYKSRLYFWDSDTQDFWYAPVNAITGTLTKFPLSRVGQFGGNLLMMVTVNVDAGDGVDDFAAFVMSSGEAIVYQGSDPGDATDWSLVGVYNIGQPVNIRSSVQVGGDVLITTYDDYVSLKKVLAEGYIGGSSKLTGAVVEAAAEYGSDFGWQSTLFPSGGLIVMNVPAYGGDFEQHVISTQTGAPAKLTGLNGSCWATFGNDLYFGGASGKVYKYTGKTDDGSDIEGDAIQAWNELGTPEQKRVASNRVVLKYGGGVNYETGIGVDFENIIAPVPSEPLNSSSLWDVSPWDTTPWGFDSDIQSEWEVAAAIGQNIAQRLRVRSSDDVSWLRTDYRIELSTN